MYTALLRVYEDHSEGNYITVEESPEDSNLVTIHVDGDDNEKYFGKADITMSLGTAITLKNALERLIQIMIANKDN
jgi:hypothetical protein